MDVLKNIMVDIETMGTRSGSVILSIGAIQFDLFSGETGKEFEINISMEDSVRHGLVTDTSTIVWWMRQSEEARKRFIDRPGVGLVGALHLFSDFVFKCGGEDCQIWGARLDFGLLSDAYDKISSSIPWDFRKERCVRTISSFAPEIRKSIPFEGIPHTPLDDCRHQIKYCSATYKYLMSE